VLVGKVNTGVLRGAGLLGSPRGVPAEVPWGLRRPAVHPPAASNCGGGQCSPKSVLGEILANERAWVAGEELGSFQVMRRS
jgi:hypothetical protein